MPKTTHPTPDSGPRDPEKNFAGFKGVSDDVVRIRRLADAYASDIQGSNILITGEKGVGKEVMAGLIHKNSVSVPDKSVFVTCNCSALPAEIAESELFGHEKGAFTGAIKKHKGFFEQAEGGTLFLDEIGNLELRSQGKFLRVIETRKFKTVGGETDKVFRGRLICATNKALDQQCGQNLFMDDLLSRIDVLQIYISPLRDRRVDIPVMIDYYTHKYGKIYAPGLSVPIEPLLMDRLLAYAYPGNVREMDNMFLRAFLLMSYDRACILKNEYLMFQNTTPQPQLTSGTADFENCIQMHIDNLVKYIVDNLKLFSRMKTQELPVLCHKETVNDSIIWAVFAATLYNKAMTAQFLAMTPDQLRNFKKPR